MSKADLRGATRDSAVASGWRLANGRYAAKKQAERLARWESIDRDNRGYWRVTVTGQNVSGGWDAQTSARTPSAALEQPLPGPQQPTSDAP